MLNDRLLTISNVDISRKELAKMSPIDFVRSLVSPQSSYRQTLEVACIFFYIKSLLEHLFGGLFSDRQPFERHVAD